MAEYLQQEVLILHDRVETTQAQLGDAENRSRRQNIRIKGVPQGAEGDYLEGYIQRLFHHVVPAFDAKDILLDRTHCAGVGNPRTQQAPDILPCLYCYRQKETILTAAKSASQFTFEG